MDEPGVGIGDGGADDAVDFVAGASPPDCRAARAEFFVVGRGGLVLGGSGESVGLDVVDDFEDAIACVVAGSVVDG